MLPLADFSSSPSKKHQDMLVFLSMDTFVIQEMEILKWGDSSVPLDIAWFRIKDSKKRPMQ